MSIDYILEVYEPGDKRAHNQYRSSTPFGAFSVGDTIKTQTQGTARIIHIGHFVSQIPGSERITHVTMIYTSID
ncbi:hypothetical protein OZX61_12805 (plasmid) [Acinetobacter sp. ESL0695]|uniref:hypothetical protein n=1 Tax=Acinetobacter sp. ESL0695 TaxID=2983215 RepID=UPI0023F5207F|nr:hypothetical protein [Acinetobacter sp. ESL0695]WEV50222.1 hypothetical protein OZX61_12805 [Acinetobacter sp. ESL0695]